MYKVLAVNDDKDFCQCCGKKNLKKVVWIENLETGDIQHFGTRCAINPAKGFALDADIAKQCKDWMLAEAGRARAAHWEYRRQGGWYVNSGKFSMKVADQELWEKVLNKGVVK